MKVSWKSIRSYGPYAYLQQSVRDGDKVTSQHVAYLGKLAHGGLLPGTSLAVPESRPLAVPDVADGTMNALGERSRSAVRSVSEQVARGVEPQDVVVPLGVRSPQSLSEARELWRGDKSGFQAWAVQRAGGQLSSRLAVDRGVDGRVYYQGGSMSLQVKGGAFTADDMTALRESVGRSGRRGGVILLDPDQDRTGDVAGIEKISVAELLDGRRFDTPGLVGQRDARRLHYDRENSQVMAVLADVMRK